MSEYKSIFTDFELNVLSSLQRDCLRSNDKIAEDLNKSGASVSRAISKLESAKVIAGYRAVVDPSKLGLSITIYSLVSLKAHGDGNTIAFEREIEAIPNIVEWARINGSWDYLLKLQVVDMPQHDRLHQKLLSMPMVSRLRGMHVIGQPQVKLIPIDFSSRRGY